MRILEKGQILLFSLLLIMIIYWFNTELIFFTRVAL